MADRLTVRNSGDGGMLKNTASSATVDVISNGIVVQEGLLRLEANALKAVVKVDRVLGHVAEDETSSSRVARQQWSTGGEAETVTKHPRSRSSRLANGKQGKHDDYWWNSF